MQAMDKSSDEAKKSVTYHLKKILREDGFLHFYKGLQMALIATTASYGSYFFLYRMLKNLLSNIFTIKTLTKRHIALITAIAGSLSAAFANPFWFTNTRMAIKNKDQSKVRMRETIRQIYKEEGIQAFYKGVVPNMILVLNPIINFVFYETIKKNFPQKSFWSIFIASSVGKLIATLATYPILTLRVKLQADKDGS